MYTPKEINALVKAEAKTMLKAAVQKRRADRLESMDIENPDPDSLYNFENAEGEVIDRPTHEEIQYLSQVNGHEHLQIAVDDALDAKLALEDKLALENKLSLDKALDEKLALELE